VRAFSNDRYIRAVTSVTATCDIGHSLIDLGFACRSLTASIGLSSLGGQLFEYLLDSTLFFATEIRERRGTLRYRNLLV
jgi:hypothetical protein